MLKRLQDSLMIATGVLASSFGIATSIGTAADHHQHRRPPAMSRSVAFRDIISCDAGCDTFCGSHSNIPCDSCPELETSSDFEISTEKVAKQSLEAAQQKFVEEHFAWWKNGICSATRPNHSQLPLTLESALIRCVANASQIKVFSDLPLIRRTAICEAQSAFDWTRFADSKWDDTSDPVGSALTGATDRYENQQLTNSFGMRRRTQIGGVLEAGQSIGTQETNSTFFQPNPQATTRLKLSYTQSLLRGRGVIYNRSLACLAQIDTKLANAEFSRQLQGHLTEIAHAYWGLYASRAVLVIRQKSIERSKSLIQQLEDRQQIDAVKPQILRAQAELAVMDAALSRAQMMVRTSEAQLRSLINDPELGSYADTELIPLDTPSAIPSQYDLERSLYTAAELRPEVSQSMLQIRAASVRLNMSKSEVLPVLNLVTETYVAGLAGNNDVDDAFVRQFSDGRPSYAVGTQYEMPLGRRAAKAQEQRRTVELRQLRNQYETTLHTLSMEVGAAVREVKANWVEFEARQVALEANQTQLESAMQRWRLLAVDTGSGSLALESILRDIDRLTQAELSFLQSWVAYNMSQFAINRATGELLTAENVSWTDYRQECGSMSTRVVHLAPTGVIR